MEETIKESPMRTDQQTTTNHKTGTYLPPPPKPLIPTEKNPYKMATEVQDKRLTTIEQQLFLLQEANRKTSIEWEMQLETLRAGIQANNKTTEIQMNQVKEEMSK